MLRILFYSLPLITFLIPLIPIWWLIQQRRELTENLQKHAQTNVRLTLHLDYLMRHFHIHGQDIPYVAQGTELDAPIICWHCQAPKDHPHAPKCPHAYVREHFRFHTGRPTLR